jgi:FlgD Ig-like domain
MRRVSYVVLLMAGFLWATRSANAGLNAGATAGLSWDAAGDSTTGAGAGGVTFPLFFHIHGASDLQQIAVILRWIPYDSTGQCYSVVPAQPDSACGWSTSQPPIGPFAGDSSYTWSIHFPSGSERACVTYWVSTTTCDTAPSAKFYIASALVIDSNGALDTLRDIADVRLVGQNPDTSYFGPHPQHATQLPPARLQVFVLPNPAVSRATIRFTLPGPVAFRLGIFDVSGRLIRRSFAIPDAGGAGQFDWDLTGSDGQRVQAGVYFARLNTLAGSRVIPISVIK